MSECAVFQAGFLEDEDKRDVLIFFPEGQTEELLLPQVKVCGTWILCEGILALRGMKDSDDCRRSFTHYIF